MSFRQLRSLTVTLTVLALTATTAPSAHAAYRYWVGDSGDWFDTANWSETEAGPGGATVPGAGDHAELLLGDAVDRAITYAPVGPQVDVLEGILLSNSGIGPLKLDKTGDLSAGALGLDGNTLMRHLGGSAELGSGLSMRDGAIFEMQGGHLTFSNWVLVGGGGTGGPGTIVHTGGIIEGLGPSPGSSVLVMSETSYPLSVYSIGGSAEVSASTLIVGNTGRDGSRVHGRLEITAASASMRFTRSLAFGDFSELSAMSGAVIDLDSANFFVSSQLPGNLADLANLTLIAEGQNAEANTFEAAGLDLGPVNAGFNLNFALGALTLGEAGDPAWLQLVDDNDNRTEDGLPEALYVDNLVLGAGSVLDLNGLNLYYRSFTDLGGTIELGGGQMMQVVPEPASFALLVLGIAAAVRRRASSPNTQR